MLSPRGGLENDRSAMPITRHSSTAPNTTATARKPPLFMNCVDSARAEASGASKLEKSHAKCARKSHIRFHNCSSRFSERSSRQAPQKTLPYSASKRFASEGRHSGDSQSQYRTLHLGLLVNLDQSDGRGRVPRMLGSLPWFEQL